MDRHWDAASRGQGWRLRRWPWAGMALAMLGVWCHGCGERGAETVAPMVREPSPPPRRLDRAELGQALDRNLEQARAVCEQYEALCARAEALMTRQDTRDLAEQTARELIGIAEEAQIVLGELDELAKEQDELAEQGLVLAHPGRN